MAAWWQATCSWNAPVHPSAVELQNLSMSMQQPPASAASASNSPRGIAHAVVAIPQPPASSPTIAITVVEPTPEPVNLLQNGTVWVAGFALLGVVITVLAAHWRMRNELSAAADRARAERDLTREQAQIDRENAAAEAHKERIATTRRAGVPRRGCKDRNGSAIYRFAAASGLCESRLCRWHRATCERNKQDHCGWRTRDCESLTAAIQGDQSHVHGCDGRPVAPGSIQE